MLKASYFINHPSLLCIPIKSEVSRCLTKVSSHDSFRGTLNFLQNNLNDHISIIFFVCSYFSH